MPKRQTPGLERPISGEMLHAADRSWERLGERQRERWSARAQSALLRVHHTSARAEYIADYLRRKLREQARGQED